MIEQIDFALQVITVDFFIGFALYSFVCIVLSLFIKKPILVKIDDQANKLIAFIGILYCAIWMIGICIMIAQNNPEQNVKMYYRMFGKYWFGYWLQPIIWIAATQLLRLEKIRKNILLRILISLVLMVSIERFTVIIISFHRDYLPSSWTMNQDLDSYPSNIALGIAVKIIVYLLFTSVFYGINTGVKRLWLRFWIV